MQHGIAFATSPMVMMHSKNEAQMQDEER